MPEASSKFGELAARSWRAGDQQLGELTSIGVHARNGALAEGKQRNGPQSPRHTISAKCRDDAHAEPKVPRLLLRRLVEPLRLYDESTRPAWVEAVAEVKTGLPDGLHHVASPALRARDVDAAEIHHVASLMPAWEPYRVLAAAGRRTPSCRLSSCRACPKPVQ